MMGRLVAVMIGLMLAFVPVTIFSQDEEAAPKEVIARAADPAPAGDLVAPPPASPWFVPARYLNQGAAYNSADFASQADAQAVLRADPADPNKLDTDRPRPDGIACENNRAPFDLVPVPR